MSTFESSSSFAAPAAARSVSTRTAGLRKTHNHRDLMIDITPTYRSNACFEVDLDEEEERIRVPLMPIVDGHRSWSREPEDDGTAINVIIQFGWIGTVRNAFARLKKTMAASEQSHRGSISAFMIFTLFFLVVMFGGSVRRTTPPIGDVVVPSGRSMRIVPGLATIPIWSPPPANLHNVQGVPSPSYQLPPSVDRAARAASVAASVSRRSTPPSESLEHGPVSLSPSARVEAADPVIVVNPPYGNMSAKFRLLYAYGKQQQQPPPQEHEHEHPDDLAALFNGAPN